MYPAILCIVRAVSPFCVREPRGGKEEDADLERILQIMTKQHMEGRPVTNPSMPFVFTQVGGVGQYSENGDTWLSMVIVNK